MQESQYGAKLKKRKVHANAINIYFLKKDAAASLDRWRRQTKRADPRYWDKAKERRYYLQVITYSE